MSIAATPPHSGPIVSRDTQIYSPDTCAAELCALHERFPDRTQLAVIGTSVLGQSIYALQMGNASAPVRVLVQAGMHGREWINTQVVMAQIEDYLTEEAYASLLEQASFLFVPLCNPDGVRIAQEGAGWIEDADARALVEELIQRSGHPYSQWKANGRGVDLNRNFDAEWSQIKGVKEPAYAHYPGPDPESEPETQALVALTREYDPTLTLSYHSRGEYIYWYFFQEGEALQRDAGLAARLMEHTGYAGLKLGNLRVDSFGGYKDWCVQALGISAFTIENGKSGWEVPVRIEHFDHIYQKCKDLTALAARG